MWHSVVKKGKGDYQVTFLNGAVDQLISHPIPFKLYCSDKLFRPDITTGKTNTSWGLLWYGSERDLSDLYQSTPQLVFVLPVDITVMVDWALKINYLSHSNLA